MNDHQRFSDRLRIATRAEHRRAESAPFLAELLSGRLARTAYASLIGQNCQIYSALERASETWRDDPVVGAFVSDALMRVPALEADLRYLLGDSWRTALSPLPATKRYINRIDEVCFSSGASFIAHHYTRYLGDLSGGQVLAKRLRAIYGLTEDGVRGYGFADIECPGLFKAEYRRRVDVCAWNKDERANILAEANLAFALSRGVFNDLGRTIGVPAGCEPGR